MKFPRRNGSMCSIYITASYFSREMILQFTELNNNFQSTIDDIHYGINQWFVEGILIQEMYLYYSCSTDDA